MKTNIASPCGRLSRACFTKPLRTISISGLLLFSGLNAASRADILYVANAGNNTIEKFTTSGSASVFANSGLNDPQGLAFDSAGNLYATNIDNTIEKFTTSGSASLFASSGLNSPGFLAFTNDAGVPLKLANQQVPEPATWAMLCGSLGMLMGFKRFARRNKR